MYNIFDYLYWRGDLDFKTEPFNEIDNIILSRLSYMPLDGIVTNEITLNEAWRINLLLGSNKYLNDQDEKLFKELASSKRYKNLILKNFINEINYDDEYQFCALTITLPNHLTYISYRGTDNTLIGWKEDLNMSFDTYLEGRKKAVEYLNNVKQKGMLIVGGHSKGGNLAIYASLKCDKNIKKRIIRIYNNDGPGFLSEITNTKEYQNIKPLIHTFIPGSSIVGRLFNSVDNYKVVKSDNKYILQHDLYSWKINKNKFSYLDSLNKNSVETEKIIDDWLNKLTYEDKKIFTNAIYNIVSSTNAKTLNDLEKNIFFNAKVILSSYKNIDDESKEKITKVFKIFISSLKKSVFNKNF